MASVRGGFVTRLSQSWIVGGLGAIVASMNAKVKLLLEATRWSTHDAEVALRAVEEEHAPAGGRDVDEWGDLDALGVAASHDTMQMLDEEEAAAGFAPLKREDLL